MTKYKNVKIIKEFKRKKPFHLATPYLLTFTSASLFTKRFMEKVSEILGDAKEFNKKSKYYRDLVQQELEELYNVETVWKNLVKRSQHSSRIVEELYPAGTKQFAEWFNREFYPSENDSKSLKHSNKRGGFKAAIFCQQFVVYMTHNRKDFPFFVQDVDLSEITFDDYLQIAKDINPDEFFCEIVKISMKKAYQSGINVESSDRKSFFTKELGDDLLKARRADIQYPISEYVGLYLVNKSLDLLAEKGFLLDSAVDKRVDYVRVIARHIQSVMEKHTFYSNTRNRWFGLKDEIGYILMMFLEQTEVISEVVKEKRVIRSKKEVDVYIYIFNHKMDNSLSFSENLPRITPPSRAHSSRCVQDWVSPVKGGEIIIKASNEAIRSLNIQQKKKFKINQNFIRILRKRDDLIESDEVPTSREYEKIDNSYRSWMKSTWHSSLNTCLYNGTKQFIRLSETSEIAETLENDKKKRGRDNENDQNEEKSWLDITHSNLVQICNMTFAECHIFSKKNEMHEEVSTIRGRRQLFNTNIDIGRVFRDFPLYYSTMLDYRFRMYPLQFLLARTSGYLKSMLEDFNPRVLTLEGLVNLLEAFYVIEPLVSRKFKDFAHSKKRSKLELKNFFFSNRIETIANQSAYFEMLEDEICRILSVKGQVKTSVALEIDQVGSGPMLVAILTGNRPLAEKCNVIQGESHCVYAFLMEKTGLFLREHYSDLVGKNQELFNFLVSSRKAQKYCLMCYFYNQKHLKRTENLKTRFEENEGRSIRDAEYELLSKFSINYENLIGETFPGLIEQLGLLENAMLAVTKQDTAIEIETIDGCLIKWDFGHYVSEKRNSWNPITRKSEKFNVSLLTLDKTKKSENDRLGRHKRSFRANLVHSIDGALMRYFIAEYYDRTKQRINHLHDCVLVHPNDVGVIYKVIQKAYTRPIMKTLAKDLVFARFINNTRGDVREEISAYAAAFSKNMESLDYLSEKEFDPRQCYKYEGER